MAILFSAAAVFNLNGLVSCVCAFFACLYCIGYFVRAKHQNTLARNSSPAKTSAPLATLAPCLQTALASANKVSALFRSVGGHDHLNSPSWITKPENTLTTRGIVNRFWREHFIASNEQPTKHELLDWLASDMRDVPRRDHGLRPLSQRKREGGCAQAAGFDNIGETLSVSPTQVDKYLSSRDRRIMAARHLRPEVRNIDALVLAVFGTGGSSQMDTFDPKAFPVRSCCTA